MKQDELKQHLHYDPDTGVFTWRDRRHLPNVGYNVACRTAGKVAGSKLQSGYWRIGIGEKQYRAHRLAWLYVYGWMPTEIDHIDGNRLNNKIENLREVTRAENQRNLRTSSLNTSDHVGVYFNKADKVWVATIGMCYERVYGGRFKTKEEAIFARKCLEQKYGFHKNHGRPKKKSPS